jgi:hypothetical protein
MSSRPESRDPSHHDLTITAGNEILTNDGRTRVIGSHQMWFGEGNARSPVVRLTIRYASGQTTITQLRVGLAP